MYSTSTVAPVLGCGPHQQNDETPKKCHPIRTLWEVERRTHKSPVGLNLCLRRFFWNPDLRLENFPNEKAKLSGGSTVWPFHEQPCLTGSKKRRELPVRGKWQGMFISRVESINSSIGLSRIFCFIIFCYTKPPSLVVMEKMCKIALSDLFDWYRSPIRWKKKCTTPGPQWKNQKVLPRSCAIPQDRPETAMK